jgi:hypothetical protein
MIPLTALWLPILLSAVAVFFVSALLRMVLTYHRSDYKALPQEGEIRAAMRKAGVRPGDYYFPYAKNTKEMGSPEMKAKLDEGPVGMMTVMPSGPPAMGKALMLWFVFCVVVGVFVAYITTRTLGPGTSYLAVFRIAGTVAFLGYGMAECVNSIWKGQAWSTTAKSVFDALVYGLLTAGVFGWLWPQ